jgi:serine/threonine protein phosphatase PrpC
MPGHLAAGTSAGLVRAHNEDSAYVGRWLCAVADGMGGHIAGGAASTAVVDALHPFDVAVSSPKELTSVLGQAVSAASGRLAGMIAADPTLDGMGSTLVAMLWTDSHVATANIGDSRAYLVRGGALTRLTEDHVMSKLVASPAPSQIGAFLVRYLNGRLDRSPDLTRRTTVPGDRYLICSDGLSGVLEPRVIRDVLISVTDPADAVTELIRLTHQAGAPDNVTVIVADTPERAWRVAAHNPLLLGAAANKTTRPSA